MTTNQRIRVVLTMTVLLCFAANLLGTFGLMGVDWRSEEASAFCFATGAGLLVGQIVLLGIWGTLGAEAVAFRLPRCLGLSVLVLFSCLFGANLSQEPLPLEVSGAAMVLFLILTGPLWIVRYLSRCRLVLAESRPSNSREQFTLRHIMMWTAVIAGMIVFGKLIFQDPAQPRVGAPSIGIVVQMVSVVAVFSILIALIGTPLVWAILWEGFPIRGWYAIGTGLVLAPVLVGESAFAITGDRPSVDDYFWVVGAIFAFGLAAATMTAAGLFLARALGFRFLPRHQPRSVTFGNDERADRW
jgi:hypothetical protein